MPKKTSKSSIARASKQEEKAYVLTVVEIDQDTPVMVDQRTKVKTCAFPFEFPDGSKGILSATKLVKSEWIPSDDLDKIVITFTHEA